MATPRSFNPRVARRLLQLQDRPRRGQQAPLDNQAASRWPAVACSSSKKKASATEGEAMAI
jgi:hypothetical protein